MRTGACFALLLLIAVGSAAQTTGSLRGRVNDAVTTSPIEDATVIVFAGDTVLSGTTDAQGRFHITGIPTGIHRVRATRIGYEMRELPEVWVRAGREQMVELMLPAGTNELATAEVSALAPQRLDGPGIHVLTVEQSLRYPATFFDPARVATTQPGMAQTNDQANHFSVRGIGPAGNAWLLEGAEIVTPNHLTNAGTPSDLPVLSGGGVTILSAQMLGTSRLLVGSQEAAFGNALGGIMDLRLRQGNSNGQGYTAQAGLLGIDLSTEGPVRKGSASYLVNYRYSTVGLLSAMGVDLGDEEITFQDLSFHISVPMKKGSLSLFGLGGLSSNRFEAIKDSAEWEYDKDSQDIDYTAQMGAAGGTFRLFLGGKAMWNTTVVLSAHDQMREVVEHGARRDFVFGDMAELDERKLSIESHVHGSLSAGWSYRAGGSAMERTVYKSYGIDEEVAGWLVRPYVHGSRPLGTRGRIDLGMAYAHWSPNSSAALEPRLSASLGIGGKSAVVLSVGQRSQLPQVQNYQVRTSSALLDNSNIGLVRSQDVSLGVQYDFQSHLVLRAQAFHQRLLDVPVLDTSGTLFDLGTTFSMVNMWDTYAMASLTPDGDATNSGIELSFQHLFEDHLYYHVNATFFDARFTDASGLEYNTRWNTNWIGNAIIGREFEKQKGDRKRTWGVNLRAVGMGGQRYLSDPDEDVQPWEGQYASYFRIDLRVYLKRERAGRTGMWALDLQDATNARNVAYRYFDQRRHEMVTKYQLGLIPNLSYRIEF